MLKEDSRKLFTIREAVKAGMWPTESGLRWQVYRARQNGLDTAIVRIGTKVLIDSEAFWRWIDRHRER